jgi:hypothetical protein
MAIPSQNHPKQDFICRVRLVLIRVEWILTVLANDPNPETSRLPLPPLGEPLLLGLSRYLTAHQIYLVLAETLLLMRNSSSTVSSST